MKKNILFVIQGMISFLSLFDWTRADEGDIVKTLTIVPPLFLFAIFCHHLFAFVFIRFRLLPVCVLKK